jgi:hypothetical protein
MGIGKVFSQNVWSNPKLGLGKDGSVEIERFRFFNPTILVDDPNGSVVRECGPKHGPPRCERWSLIKIT